MSPAQPDPWAQAEGRPKAQLRKAVNTWEDLEAQTRILKERIRDAKQKNKAAGQNSNEWVIDPADIEDWYSQLDAVVAKRERARDFIVDLVEDSPRLKDEAVAWGFKPELLSDVGQGGAQGGGSQGPASGGNGGTGTQGPPSGNLDPDEANADAVDTVAGSDQGFDADKPNKQAQARNNRLLGKKGQDYDIVRGPKGSYVARYKFKIDGEVVQIGVRIPRNELARYGIKQGEGKAITKEQMKRIQNIGWADELAPHIRQGDKHVMKALTRYLRNQYGGQGILGNDEVMATVIANSMFGWSAGEFENRLRQTKWYQDTNEYQRQWQTTMSAEQQKETTQKYEQQVVNALEEHYGFDWAKYVEGGVKQVRVWAEQIARGRWGEPGEGFALWSEKQFDKAAALEGTPAWVANQKKAEDDRAYLNRPEDMFETLRDQELARFGRTIMDHDTRMAWATDIVTEAKPNSDWDELMRRTQKQLYPFFDENFTYTEQATPFKGAIRNVIGTDVDWDDPLMQQIGALDKDGNVTDQTRSLYDFEQYIRDNDPRFWSNPQTEEKGRQFGQELLSLMGGV